MSNVLMLYCFHAAATAAASSVCVSHAGGICSALTSSGNIVAVEVVFVCFEGTVSDHAR